MTVDRSHLLITRKELMYALGIDRSTLSRAGKKGRIPRGTWNQPVNGDPKEVGFCYTRAEALHIAEHYGRGTIPEHLFRVSPEGLRSAVPASVKSAVITDRDKYAHLIRAHRLMAEALRLFDLHGVPFPDPYGSAAIATYYAAQALEEAQSAAPSYPVDPWDQFNALVSAEAPKEQAPYSLVGLDTNNIFAHLDDEARALAPGNLKRGFKLLAKHDWEGDRLLRKWNGAPLTEAEYALYRSDPDNWADEIPYGPAGLAGY